MADNIHRREFLASSGKSVFAVGTGLTILADSRSARAVVANEKVSLAMIGVRGRGHSLAGGFLERDDCEITHVCDVNTSTGTARSKQYTEQQGGKQVEFIQDYRDLLQEESVDAVVIATPDHWHGPLSVFSCQAGKDVYVEKPASHNPWEGQQMVKAARKYERIVQVGTQCRSAPYIMAAKKYIEDGKLGKIHLCRVYNQKGPMSNTSSMTYGDPPADLNWDVWNGPAVESEYSRQLMQWHSWWRYSGGDLANDGVHQLDVARWLCGVGCPKGARAAGGIHASQGLRESPDTLVGSYDYDGLTMTIDDTHFGNYMLKSDPVLRSSDILPHWPHNSTRIEIFGTKGLMCMGRHGGGWQVFSRPQSRQPVVEEQMYGRFPDPDHKENFITSIRTRQRPNADVEEGHLSALLVHFANISYRLGGANLVIDPETEQIVGNAEAMKLFKREYRQPYAIPEEV